MNKIRDRIKDKKIIGISALLIIIGIISVLTYGKNKNNVFKDEYMKDIFVEDNYEEVDNYSQEINLNKNEDDIYIDLPENNNLINTAFEKSINKIVVEIKGEVLKPDVYTLNEGSIIKDLIEAAGGLTSEADISNINRAKEISNHELVIIRNINNVNLEEDKYVIEENIVENDLDNGVININTADLSKLREIPGIGEVKAKAIITYREKNGGFKSIDEIKNVDGIGEKTFESMRDMIKI